MSRQVQYTEEPIFFSRPLVPLHSRSILSNRPMMKNVFMYIEAVAHNLVLWRRLIGGDGFGTDRDRGLVIGNLEYNL